MPIKHPSMKKLKSQPNKVAQPKTYVVPDEEFYEDQGEINQEGLTETEPEENSLLSQLIFLGRAEKNVEVGGMTFKIVSLSQQETRSLMKEITAHDKDEIDNFLVRAYTLAHSIESVNGVPLEDIGNGYYDSVVEAKLDVLNRMQNSVLEKLNEEVNLLAKVDEELDGEQVKK